jgi:sporulation protein YlmC with PRC-barrel domain
MLRNSQELKLYAMAATDGEVGHVSDLFFDDEDWVIRYLVVQTGSWLMSRQVLISPYSLGKPDWKNKRLPVHISKAQVKASPDIDTDMPVSRRHEAAYADYYRYPYYWEGSGYWGDGLYFPTLMAPDYTGQGPMGRVQNETADSYARAEASRHGDDDPHLRSCKAVVGYHVHAKDGDLGHISEMLVDEETWAIRYLVVDTSNWWMGQKVLVPPQWMTAISWDESKIEIDLTRETIKNSPSYESTGDLNRQQERALYQHYGRPNYWEREHMRETVET